MIFAQLADVHQTVDVVFELHESAKAGDLRNRALDDVAHLEATVDLRPWIGIKLLDAKTDALVRFVDAKHHGFHFVALLEDLRRVVDLARPAQVGHVDHPVNAFFQFHKRTVSGQVADRTAHLRANRVTTVDLVPWVGLQLTHAQRNLAFLRGNAQHNSFQLLTHRQHIRRTCNALGPGQLGNVNEAFDPVFHFHERAVSNQLRDLAANAVAHRITSFDVFPRVVLKLLQTQGNPLLVAVHFQNHQIQRLANRHHLARVRQAAPRHVGDVQQSVHPVEVHEHTKVGDVLGNPGDLVARSDGIQELLALFGALGLDDFAAGKNDVFAVVVDLDDLELEHFANVLVEIFRWNDVHLAARQERFHAHIDHQAAFDHRLDLAFDQSALLEDFDNLLPVLLVGGFFFRQDHHALVVFQFLEENLDFVADLDVFVLKFVGGNSAFRLVTDIDQNDLRFDFEDAALNDGPLVEFAK